MRSIIISFLLVMDWILKKAADGGTNGIEWKEALQCRNLAHDCHKHETSKSSTPQMAKDILGITRKDIIRNEEVRRKTGKLENIIKQKRLRWWGHVKRMEVNRVPIYKSFPGTQ